MTTGAEVAVVGITPEQMTDKGTDDREQDPECETDKIDKEIHSSAATSN